MIIRPGSHSDHFVPFPVAKFLDTAVKSRSVSTSGGGKAIQNVSHSNYETSIGDTGVDTL